MSQNVSPPGSGDDSTRTAALKAAIARIWIERDRAMIRLANRQIARYRVELPDWDAEDAVQDTMVALCKAADEYTLPVFATDDDQWNYICAAIHGQVLRARARHSAIKRGKGYRRSDVDLDQRTAAAPPHEAEYEFKDALRHWLEGTGDKSAHRIIHDILEGWSSQEIAGRLGVSVSTIERKRKLIRTLLESDFLR